MFSTPKSRVQWLTALFVLAVAVSATTAHAAAPVPVTVSAAFVGYPSCVVPGQNAKFPLVVTNSGANEEVVYVHLSYISKAQYADPYSLVIASGTDHLVGSPGYQYWQFRLKPGQSVKRTLVALIPWPWETQKGPGQYGVTMFISVARFPLLRTPVSATPVYCDAP